jgi:hypothetical protein
MRGVTRQEPALGYRKSTGPLSWRPRFSTRAVISKSESLACEEAPANCSAATAEVYKTLNGHIAASEPGRVRCSEAVAPQQPASPR